MNQINGRDTAVSGVLHIDDVGYGFLRQAEDSPSLPEDIYLSARQIERFALEDGDRVRITARQLKPGVKELYFAATQIRSQAS